MFIIISTTYPSTMYFKFITKCGKCYYKLRQLVYYKVRQVVLQCATILLLKKCDCTPITTLLSHKLRFKHLPSVLFVLRHTLKTFCGNQSACQYVLSNTSLTHFPCFIGDNSSFSHRVLLLNNSLAVRLIVRSGGSGVSRKINVCSAVPFKFTNGKLLRTKLVATYTPIHEDLSLIHLFTHYIPLSCSP